MNIDIPNGVIQMTPPAVVAGEVTARILGLSINEWFYIVSIGCMAISTIASVVVAVMKARNLTRKEATDEPDEISK